jgi:uncharacterized Tic20 family protein
MFGLQVILPAITRWTVGRGDPFVRASSAEALNFQVIWIGVFVLLMIASVNTHSNALGWVTAGIFEVMGLYGIVCGIVGARKAWRGETWRYPVNLRIIH